MLVAKTDREPFILPDGEIFPVATDEQEKVATLAFEAAELLHGLDQLHGVRRPQENIRADARRIVLNRICELDIVAISANTNRVINDAIERGSIFSEQQALSA